MECTNLNCQEPIEAMISASRCYECELLGRVDGDDEVDIEFMNKFYRIVNKLNDNKELLSTSQAYKVWFKVSTFRRKELNK